MKLPRVSGKEVAKAVEKCGFERKRTVGSHHVYAHTDGRKTVIPIHTGETIGPGLLNKIIKQDLQISRVEFMSKMR